MRKIISIVLSFGMLFQQSGLLYAAGEINLANYLSQARNAIVQPDRFQPARLRYISYDMANNDFKLLLDKGNAKLNDATPELFNYFLIGLALPNDTFWVNLRPDAPENIIDPLLEKTDIGKIFLEADLQLKKDTAGLTSPQNPEGKAYWDKLYKKVGELFGTENITIPTITRPWIVPNEVIVRETEDSAYIYKATLKVMLESDYLIGRGGSRTAPTPDQYAFSDPRLKELNEYSTRLIRETIIPKLTKEINSSKRYAQLRQVYYSLVLSRWFKQKYSSLGSTRAQGASTPANSYLSLIDSGNLDKLASKEPCDKQTYFQAYQKSFKDGEYNLKETVATPFGQSIRSYVSGGISVGSSSIILDKFNTPKKENMEVTKALTDQIPLVTTASPLSITDIKKEAKLALSQAGPNLKQHIKDYEGHDMSPKAIDMLSEETPEAVSQWLNETINALKAILKDKPSYYNPNTGFEVSQIMPVFEGLIKKINDAQGSMGGQVDILKGSAGSPLTRLGDFLSALESESNNIYNKEAKNAISMLINTIKQQIKLISEGRYPPSVREIGERMIKTEWKDLCDQMPEIKNLLFPKYNDVIKALASYSEFTGSPVIKGKKLPIIDSYGNSVVYINYWDLSDYEKETFINVVEKYGIFDGALDLFDGNMRFAVTIDALGIAGVIAAIKYNEKGIVTETRILRFLDDKRKERIQSEMRKAFKEEISQSRHVVGSPVMEKSVGGIDLTDRALHIKLERVGSFAATPLLLPQVKNAQGLDLDREFEQIEALASSGISPNSRRILELFTVCHYRGEFGQRLTQIISCLKASSAIQEAEAIDSDEDFRLALMMPEVLS